MKSSFVRFLEEKGLGDIGNGEPDDKLVAQALEYAASHYQDKVLDFLHMLSLNDEKIKTLIASFKDRRNGNTEHPELDAKDVLSMPDSDHNGPI